MYARVTSFVSTLFRDHGFGRPRRAADAPWEHDNVVIVTHGLTLRLLLMRYFQWSVRTFEETLNPDNACLVVLEREAGATPDTPGHFVLRDAAGIVGPAAAAGGAWEAHPASGMLHLGEPGRE